MIDEENVLDGKHLKIFKERFKITKDTLKEQISEIDNLIGRIENDDAQSSAMEGLDELKLAYASLHGSN
tara:strand:- start:568 stop:774 length:207 start_codon:yes stop_codon:yes gene_type:complete